MVAASFARIVVKTIHLFNPIDVSNKLRLVLIFDPVLE